MCIVLGHGVSLIRVQGETSHVGLGKNKSRQRQTRPRINDKESLVWNVMYKPLYSALIHYMSITYVYEYMGMYVCIWLWFGYMDVDVPVCTHYPLSTIVHPHTHPAHLYVYLFFRKVCWYSNRVSAVRYDTLTTW